ncbi:NupC family nucleoside transporter [Colletotrichum truncatum]|uniref:NupC family nucleoside transporter n=1 Tax=Colletotrichum truncatum TaxID=5467 RepID=A0ACC3YRU0_COLTU|nr:NupC family nucleoside transporter [Colletotrichum truncatum]KAF6799346.1 NupC family nucleoside transporter [Colletotrichum truncatum]
MASHVTEVNQAADKPPYQSPAGTPPRRNSDPALEISNQHQHPHVHHSSRIDAKGHEDNVVYTQTGQSTVPHQSHLHQHHEPLDIEKGGSPDKLSGPPDYDGEKPGIVSPPSEEERRKRFNMGAFYKKYKWAFHIFFGAFFTGWWIASLVLHRHDKNWVVPFLVWLGIMLRLVFFYVPSSYVSRPIKFVWQHSAVFIYNAIPAKFRTFAGAALTIAVMLVGSFVSEEEADNTRENRAVSIFGLIVILFCFWVTSRDRRRVNWRPVIGGMLSQYIIALFVLRTSVGYDIFKFIADRAGDLLGFAEKGTAFLTSQDIVDLHYFISGVIPPIIFFVAIVQVLYFIGFLQWFIGKFATFVFWALRVSGAEAVVAAATPFIGQGESAMLVRPFVPHMTKAEIHQIMTCGFATISGSVLVGYIRLGLNAQAMVSSCVMSIPASIAISKLRYPEREETLTAGKVVIPEDDEQEAKNAIHAFANGAYLGIKIAGTIVASILCILAFIGLVDGLLSWWGRYLNINDPLTLNLIIGYMFYPIAFLLGVPRNGDLLKVARLIALKVVANEYVAFTEMSKAPYTDLSPRSQLIATYALCGFGNIGSLGIQIGILSQLAPSRGGDVSALAVSALISGVMSTLTSAAVAGLVVTHQSTVFGGAS